MKRIYLTIVIALIISATSDKCVAQWTQINLPSGYLIAQMQFVNDSVGYIIADSIVGLQIAGKVYKTTDRGLTWSQKNFYYLSFDYMYFIDANTGWICATDGATATLRKTIDGGNTWVNIAFNAPSGPMFFISPSVGYISWVGVGPQGAVVYKTTDGGVTWNSTGINLGISGIQDMMFVDSTAAYLGGLYGPTLGRINTFNTTYTTFSTDIAVTDIDYEMNSNQLFFCGEEFGVNSGLYKTTSTGSPINLVIDNSITLLGATSVKCKNSNEIICGGQQGAVALSNDGGNNWNIESTGSQTTFIDVYLGSDFALAAGGSELYRRNLSLSIDENPSSPGFGIYPNPATALITIESKTIKIKSIKLLTVLGICKYQSEINTIKTEINISGMAKGIYIAELTDEKKNIVNKKIIIE